LCTTVAPQRLSPLTTRQTAVSLPGTSDDASTTVSSASMRTWRWSRLAMRDSADIGSPCEPVEMRHSCSGGRSSISFASTMSPGGIVR
jgi:hypothetical protein